MLDSKRSMPTVKELDLDTDILTEVYGNLWYIIVLHSEGMNLRILERSLVDICKHTLAAARSLTATVLTQKSAIVATTTSIEEALVMQEAFTARNIETIVSRHV